MLQDKIDAAERGLAFIENYYREDERYKNYGDLCNTREDFPGAGWHWTDRFPTMGKSTDDLSGCDILFNAIDGGVLYLASHNLSQEWFLERGFNCNTDPELEWWWRNKISEIRASLVQSDQAYIATLDADLQAQKAQGVPIPAALHFNRQWYIDVDREDLLSWIKKMPNTKIKFWDPMKFAVPYLREHGYPGAVKGPDGIYLFHTPRDLRTGRRILPTPNDPQYPALPAWLDSLEYWGKANSRDITPRKAVELIEWSIEMYPRGSSSEPGKEGNYYIYSRVGG